MNAPNVEQRDPQLSALDQAQMAASYRDAEIAQSAQWFYYIAGLSVLNAILVIANSPIVMAIGLSTSELAMMMFGAVVGLVVAFVGGGFFGAMGFFASQGAAWAFILGIIVFGVDTALCFLMPQIDPGLRIQWMSVAIHGYALFCLGKGMMLTFQKD